MLCAPISGFRFFGKPLTFSVLLPLLFFSWMHFYIFQCIHDFPPKLICFSWWQIHHPEHIYKPLLHRVRVLNAKHCSAREQNLEFVHWILLQRWLNFLETKLTILLGFASPICFFFKFNHVKDNIWAKFEILLPEEHYLHQCVVIN